MKNIFPCARPEGYSRTQGNIFSILYPRAFASSVIFNALPLPSFFFLSAYLLGAFRRAVAPAAAPWWLWLWLWLWLW